MERKLNSRLGWALSILPALMLLFSASLKLTGGQGLAEGFAHLGWPLTQAIPLAVLEISCTVIYLIPRTAVLGAILVTGYMGGAVATHTRVGDPLWGPILVGVFVWAGLYLREARLRDLLPLLR
jgi:hypothetical protein